MNLDEYGIDPADQINALNPIHPPRDGACALPQAEFKSWKHQIDTYDGVDDDPPLSIVGARAVCRRCPVLTDCLEYARVSCVDEGFLAGMTAAERAIRRRKRDRIQLRDRQTRALSTLGIATADIAAELEVDVTVVRRHRRGWATPAPRDDVRHRLPRAATANVVCGRTGNKH